MPSALAGSNFTDAIITTTSTGLLPLSAVICRWLLLVKFEDFPVCVTISGARELALGFSEYETFVEDH